MVIFLIVACIALVLGPTVIHWFLTGATAITTPGHYIHELVLFLTPLWVIALNTIKSGKEKEVRSSKYRCDIKRLNRELKLVRRTIRLTTSWIIGFPIVVLCFRKYIAAANTKWSEIMTEYNSVFKIMMTIGVSLITLIVVFKLMEINNKLEKQERIRNKQREERERKRGKNDEMAAIKHPEMLFTSFERSVSKLDPLVDITPIKLPSNALKKLS